MRRFIILMILFLIIGVMGFSGTGQLPAAPQESGAVQQEAGAYQEAGETGPAPNYFLKGGIFLGGLILIWFLFYYLVYPFLVRYYSAGYCKSVFWSLVLLYSVSWIAVTVYVLFEVGFYIEWLKYVFAFIGGIWLIWFMVMMLKRDRAYYG